MDTNENLLDVLKKKHFNKQDVDDAVDTRTNDLDIINNKMNLYLDEFQTTFEYSNSPALVGEQNRIIRYIIDFIHDYTHYLDYNLYSKYTDSLFHSTTNVSTPSLRSYYYNRLKIINRLTTITNRIKRYLKEFNRREKKHDSVIRKTESPHIHKLKELIKKISIVNNNELNLVTYYKSITNPFSPGLVIGFSYVNAKYKGRLPYWDISPIILYLKDCGDGSFYGLNIHYLALSERIVYIRLINDIISNYKYNKDNLMWVSIIADDILNKLPKMLYDKMIHRYIYNRINGTPHIINLGLFWMDFLNQSKGTFVSSK